MERAVTAGSEAALGPGSLTVRTAESLSTIVVESGALARLGALLSDYLPEARRAFVISDEQVWEAHGERVSAILTASGFEIVTTKVPAGEESKSLALAGELYAWLAAARAERREPIIAFGGGVVGDLAGFVAATYLRGVPLVQVPTSLLAMVDSSVGGKTGVNLPAGKNLVGAFLQPGLVVVDPALLMTLPPREQRSGWAEVIKYAFFDRTVPGLTGPPLLPIMSEEADALRALSEPLCSGVITQCLRIKAAVVEQDERETGLRRVLNLGHTIGHAIEAVAGYGRYTHGEAVALGTRAAAHLSARRGLCDPALVAQVDTIFDAFGLPARIEGCSAAALLDRLGSDKKVRAGRVNWILPTDPGCVEIRDDVPLTDVRAVLAELGAS
ncbi:MAG TPA: 3-dehydroquinate synthase [Thermomicrobiales bacterium]